ncbi:hypothetical protein ABH926_007117 [Catenulispora sp. GP43]
MTTRTITTPGRAWAGRVQAADWAAVAAELVRTGRRHTLALVFHDAT